ncbi:hypothetical protein CR513_39044, partial [Mucuna pruriens]
MDRSGTSNHNLGRKGEAILLEKNCMPLWTPDRHLWNQVVIYLHRTSPNQRSSRGKGTVDKGTTVGALVIPHIPHSTTQDTPFRLTFGKDAMIPLLVEESSPRATFFQPNNNEDELRVNIKLLQEEREMAHIQECATKVRVTKRHNSTEKVREGAFKLEHLDGRLVPHTWNTAMLRKYYN